MCCDQVARQPYPQPSQIPHNTPTQLSAPTYLRLEREVLDGGVLEVLPQTDHLGLVRRRVGVHVHGHARRLDRLGHVQQLFHGVGGGVEGEGSGQSLTHAHPHLL